MERRNVEREVKVGKDECIGKGEEGEGRERWGVQLCGTGTTGTVEVKGRVIVGGVRSCEEVSEGWKKCEFIEILYSNLESGAEE